ncbi:hypothetical protein UFOVP383_14 [uncultured Caudovirales phage]|jgi:hypothetical protein|uniref:Uncharacterized protein n=1 Tax=uncultured Caudovirales phage TaxID=2100421 RepID=A0A6J7X2B4_9CAUD|nr:hypothetical protein UFOVP383_14 [uncultured Caudovirales phage]
MEYYLAPDALVSIEQTLRSQLDEQARTVAVN